ncbi:MAG TPA: hypothetical protein VFJ63_01630 [Candidatus Bathyarchaeia archaeon]|nr:hypothetical protein [Candidatus Bathyarchaeia archaeon]
MTDSRPNQSKPNPRPRAVLVGFIAGIVAGIASYEIVGIVGLVIGFIGGMIVGSRTVLMVEKSKEQTQ